MTRDEMMAEGQLMESKTLPRLSHKSGGVASRFPNPQKVIHLLARRGGGKMDDFMVLFKFQFGKMQEAFDAIDSMYDDQPVYKSDMMRLDLEKLVANLDGALAGVETLSSELRDDLRK